MRQCVAHASRQLLALFATRPGGSWGKLRGRRGLTASETKRCVRTVSHASRNPGATPSLTRTHRGTSLLREVVDQNCVGRISYASARVSGIYFQACSFNHSDISPHARGAPPPLAHPQALLRVLRINGLRATQSAVSKNCVRPLNLAQSLAAHRVNRPAAGGFLDELCWNPKSVKMDA